MKIYKLSSIILIVVIAVILSSYSTSANDGIQTCLEYQNFVEDSTDKYEDIRNSRLDKYRSVEDWLVSKSEEALSGGRDIASLERQIESFESKVDDFEERFDDFIEYITTSSSYECVDSSDLEDIRAVAYDKIGSVKLQVRSINVFWEDVLRPLVEDI